MDAEQDNSNAGGCELTGRMRAWVRRAASQQENQMS
jgi:hypothetical protein